MKYLLAESCRSDAEGCGRSSEVDVEIEKGDMIYNAQVTISVPSENYEFDDATITIDATVAFNKRIQTLAVYRGEIDNEIKEEAYRIFREEE